MKKHWMLLSIFMVNVSCAGFKKVTIALAGDTMLGRLVNQTLLLKTGDEKYKYPWGNTLPILREADLRIVNLETTLTRSKDKTPKVFNFKSDPKNVLALKEAGIDVVSLANNHIKDFGNEGLLETVKTLKEAGIKFVGAGKNITQARAPVIVKRKGQKIGILGATDNEPTWAATDFKPGINYFNINNLAPLLADIKKLKRKADIVIVSLHWGPNMKERPSQAFINAAQKMINAGADIIHGHSAHIFQGIEKYNGKLILYDTGDFVDDYRVDPKLRNDRSFIFLVNSIKSDLKSAELIPIKIDTMQANLATEPDKSLMIKRMRMLSQELDTKISRQGSITFP